MWAERNLQMTNHVIHNKLVRDLIPEQIVARGENVSTEVIRPRDMRLRLFRKLQEEVRELGMSLNISDGLPIEYGKNSDPLEEMADVMEVILALAENLRISPAQLEEARLKKLAEKGGFKRKILLISTGSIEST